MLVHNPVLRGFHPDPSIVYVKGKFYLATSTFEYFPGVRIYSSCNLADWELAACPLDTARFLDMTGNETGGGVWAPCLSYCGETFYLVYSNVHNWKHDAFKDVDNYIITSEDLKNWSDPVYLNSSGFDASLFHDEDGRKWLLNVNWDFQKKGNRRFGGILIQEFDERAGKLIGEVRNIFTGTSRALVEGPHIYRINGYYYLFTAEGGTEYMHAETVARSKTLFGPYRVHPDQHVLSAYKTDNKFQRTGHGSLCYDGNNWYLAYLCGRPLSVGGKKRCILGRETSIQELVFDESGWPRLRSGGMVANGSFDNHRPEAGLQEKIKIDYDFSDAGSFGDFHTLRIPFTEEIGELDTKKRCLYLRGQESLVSRHTQALLARRQQSFRFQAKTLLRFEPECFRHMAGLIYRYNEENQYYLYLTYDEGENRKVLKVMTIDHGVSEIADTGVSVGEDVWLGLQVKDDRGQFSYSEDGLEFHPVFREFDSSILSDEYASPQGFTGAFVGMACQDLKNHCKRAQFIRFLYEEQ